jgi:sugar lactone lactonase YvrE
VNTHRIGRAIAPRVGIAMVAMLLAVGSARAETEIRSLTETIDGHSVGGVTIDLVGNLYIADFGDLVWKITLDGKRQAFATGFYGASGNAIDGAGNLLQSSFYGDTVTRIDRGGQIKLVVTAGLSGPVGIAVSKQTGEAFVANCRGNFIARVAVDGTVSPFARSEFFKCPNGIAFDPEGNLYVVNFRDNRMLKVDPKGAVTPFTTVSDKGLGHLCFKDNRFYVTAYQSHEIYAVSLDGAATRLLGNGERGVVDGAGAKARLSFPNGIACHPWAQRLYVNEFVAESVSVLPPRAIIREVALEAGSSSQ